MGVEEFLYALFLIALLYWGWKAVVMTPFERNLYAIVSVGCAFFFFLLSVRLWKAWLVFFAVIFGAYALAEFFPKNPANLQARRMEVTAAQDLMVFVGLMMSLVGCGLWAGMK